MIWSKINIYPRLLCTNLEGLLDNSIFLKLFSYRHFLTNRGARGGAGGRGLSMAMERRSLKSGLSPSSWWFLRSFWPDVRPVRAPGRGLKGRLCGDVVKRGPGLDGSSFVPKITTTAKRFLKLRDNQGISNKRSSAEASVSWSSQKARTRIESFIYRTNLFIWAFTWTFATIEKFQTKMNLFTLQKQEMNTIFLD